MSNTMIIFGNPNSLGRGTKHYFGGKTFLLKKEEQAEQSAKALFMQACNILNPSPEQTVAREEIFDGIVVAGRQDIRTYHDFTHFLEISRGQNAADKLPSEIKPAIEATRFLAGMFHDVVYHHVDVKGGDHTGFAAGVRDIIGKYIDVSNNQISISKDSELAQDQLFRAAMDLFGHDENNRVTNGITLNPFAGQNEFLSALYAIEQSRKIGIPDKYILAQIVHIRGTVPFQSANIFEELEKVYEKLNSQMQPPLPKQDGKEVIKSTVRMANDDVASFKKDFPAFISNTAELMKENARGGPAKLDDPDVMLAACMGPIGFLGMVAGKSSTDGSMKIFHSVKGEPPEQDRRAEWEAKACKNISMMKTYLSAHAAAAALVTALHVSNNNLTNLDGISLKGLGMRSCTLEPEEAERLSRDDYQVLKSLKDDQFETARVAAYLLQRLGAKKVEELAALANKTGIQASNGKSGIANKATVEVFLGEVLNGLDDVKTALTSTLPKARPGAAAIPDGVQQHHGYFGLAAV